MGMVIDMFVVFFFKSRFWNWIMSILWLYRFWTCVKWNAFINGIILIFVQKSGSQRLTCKRFWNGTNSCLLNFVLDQCNNYLIIWWFTGNERSRKEKRKKNSRSKNRENSEWFITFCGDWSISNILVENRIEMY